MESRPGSNTKPAGFLWGDVWSGFHGPFPIHQSPELSFDGGGGLLHQVGQALRVAGCKNPKALPDPPESCFYPLGWGVPIYLVSDQGPQFTSPLLSGLCDARGVTQKLATTYHPADQPYGKGQPDSEDDDRFM